MENKLDYSGMTKEMEYVLFNAMDFETKTPMSRHYYLGQIMAIIQRYDKQRSVIPKVV